MTPEDMIRYYSLQVVNADIQIKYWQAMKDEAQEAYDMARRNNIAPVVIAS
jgi:hypothetical protein